MPAPRRPQINFQVEPALKTLYEQARESGHWVARLCAAGLLLMVEDDAARLRALNRLRDWEVEYEGASEREIRDFVQGAASAMRRGARGSRPSRSTRPVRKKAKRAGS
ncbi:MAG: hypothetical protein KDA32_13020 [Phycisphaerales bacterium]|nr:hypothetical protein [Phycisphaerales bacterium]